MTANQKPSSRIFCVSKGELSQCRGGLGGKMEGAHCTNFGIYKTFTFHVNILKYPLSLPLFGIYFTFLSSKVKDLRVFFLSSLLDVSKTVMSHFVVSLS